MVYHSSRVPCYFRGLTRELFFYESTRNNYVSYSVQLSSMYLTLLSRRCNTLPPDRILLENVFSTQDRIFAKCFILFNRVVEWKNKWLAFLFDFDNWKIFFSFIRFYEKSKTNFWGESYDFYQNYIRRKVSGVVAIRQDPLFGLNE